MRQLHVITASQRRGAEVFARDLCAALAERNGSGDVVRLVALTEGPQGNALEVDILGERPLGFCTLRALRATARDADVVVAHGSTTLPASVSALAGMTVPLVYRNIGDPAVWSGRGLRRLRVASLLRRVRHVVAVWPGAAQTLTTVHRVNPAKLTVIPNGVVGDRYRPATPERKAAARQTLGLPLDPDVPVVVHIGALSPEKDVATAIRAIATASDATGATASAGGGKGAQLVVVGDGPERDELGGLAEQLAPGRVHFVGVLPRPDDALAAADALILTSRTEGMPGVLVEAGLAGLPTVASDVGGVPEIVRDGETGVLVAPGDSAGFAAGLEKALAGAATLGSAAREHCLAHFDMAVLAPRWATVLEQVAG